MSNSAYLAEAFKELEILEEDAFSVTDDGIEKYNDFIANDDAVETVSVIDDTVETVDDLADSYIGKAIIDCCVCHSKMYRDMADIKPFEDSGLVNVEEECPFCYSIEGFKLIGKVAPIEDEKAEEKTEEQPEEEGEEIEESLGSYVAAKRLQKLKSGEAPKKPMANASHADKAKYHDYMDKVQKLTKKAEQGAVKGGGIVKPNKTQQVLNQIDADAKKKSAEKAAETKAKKASDTAKKELATRLGLEDEKKLDKLLKDAGYTKVNESVNEEFKYVTVTTEDTHMEMTADEDGKVTVTTMPMDKVEEKPTEVIAPIDDADIAEIEADAEGDAEIAIDDFSEDEFNELGESFLKNTYSNISSFKTTSVESNGNRLALEGLITFASGKTKKTNFIFEAKDITKRGKARFIGENHQICNGRKSFTMLGTVKDGKFISESLNYNYRTKDASNGKSQRVYGTVRVKK